ncbi:type VI secretion system lipoprotein TssJ [Methyloprofundus sp.]|uniref:type VI secretion system lipoprotein TssJ n=1 Tax=Methyloprofundus sp. TaxID=2020875 RepID=UPI003D0B26F2
MQDLGDTKIAVSAKVNPDINNRPSPIVVRVFELKNLGIYTESDFYDLFENYESVLGGDLLASEQFHLNPGDTQTLKNSIATETKYIAVIAAFRDINRAMWRDAAIIPVEKDTQILIYVDKLSVSVWKK